SLVCGGTQRQRPHHVVPTFVLIELSESTSDGFDRLLRSVRIKLRGASFQQQRGTRQVAPPLRHRRYEEPEQFVERWIAHKHVSQLGNTVAQLLQRKANQSR